MTNSTLLDRIIDSLLPEGLRVIARLRRLLLGAVKSTGGYDNSQQILQNLNRILTTNATYISQAFRRPLIASWLSPVYDLSREAHADSDNIEPPTIKLSTSPVGDPNREFLFHKQGIDWLKERNVVPSWMLPRLDAAAKHNAEQIAHATTQQTARKLADALSDSIRKGGTIRNFREAVGEAFDASPLSAPQLETLYRTNGGRAYSAGQQYVLSHPLVGSEFPYVLYSATHDSRVEHNHLMMESLGLDGTAVYRADDPVIRRFWPPWRWNCRCHVIPLSVGDAARHGCTEAKQWLLAGRPPTVPQFVKSPPFDLPKGWVPVNGRIQFPTPVV